MHKCILGVLLLATVLLACVEARKKEGCRYQRGEWSECEAGDKKKTMTMTLREGQPDTCEQTKVVTRRCRAKKEVCRYAKGQWSDCDPISNMRTRQDTLKKGGATCEEVKTVEKKCKKQCKYDKGTWSEFDGETRKKTRVDTLQAGQDETCEQQKVVQKRCRTKRDRKMRVERETPSGGGGNHNAAGGGQSECKYERGAWSDCDVSTGSRRMRMTLKEGSDLTCEAERVRRKPCRTRTRTNRCKFGPWGEWSECQDGERTRSRELKSGGDRCNRRTSKTKAC